MTPLITLIELLARVGAQNGAAVFLTTEELGECSPGVAAAMKSQKLIVKARPASSAMCPGCERECVMPVHTPPTRAPIPASFIVCDKRSDINRVPVAADRLTQWQCSADAIVRFVANSLGLRRSEQRSADSKLLNIGVATGDKRSQMLGLRAGDNLELVAGTNALPLADLIEYRDGRYSLNGTIVRQLVDSAATVDNRYTPNIAKREARKLDTQRMYMAWQKAFRDLKKKHPNKSDVWHSEQIAKMPIAKCRIADTIRKHMKL